MAMVATSLEQARTAYAERRWNDAVDWFGRARDDTDAMSGDDLDRYAMASDLVGHGRRAIEVGTLIGYSAIHVARALPADGHLWTIEFERKHADLARANLAAAGVAAKVTVCDGAGVDVLPTLEPHGPFDAVFIDADKVNYHHYGRWAVANLRPGGIVLGDNAESAFRQAMRYPPAVALVNVVVKGRTPGAAMADAGQIVDALRSSGAPCRVLGPATAPLSRLKGEHRAQFFIKGTHRGTMRRALLEVLESRPEIRRRSVVDVDPMSVL